MSEVIGFPSAETRDLPLNVLKVTGKGSCHGGVGPNLQAYPLLVFMHKGHPKFKKLVFLEDQSASVEEIALELSKLASIEALAKKFKTSEDHIRQALSYAVKCNFLGI